MPDQWGCDCSSCRPYSAPLGFLVQTTASHHSISYFQHPPDTLPVKVPLQNLQHHACFLHPPEAPPRTPAEFWHLPPPQPIPPSHFRANKAAELQEATARSRAAAWRTLSWHILAASNKQSIWSHQNRCANNVCPEGQASPKTTAENPQVS